MRVERVVVDTNVFISAAIMPKGKARAALDLVLANSALMISKAIFEELETRLARPKFDRYVDAQDRAEFLRLIASAAIWVDISGQTFGVRDPDDDKIIETAITGNADCLVTGDGDLLALRPVGESDTPVHLDDAYFRGVAILRPAEFLAFFASDS